VNAHVVGEAFASLPVSASSPATEHDGAETSLSPASSIAAFVASGVIPASVWISRLSSSTATATNNSTVPAATDAPAAGDDASPARALSPIAPEIDF
jgi:hypothetical protein